MLDLTPNPPPAYMFVHGETDVELINNLAAIGYPIAGVIYSPETHEEGAQSQSDNLMVPIVSRDEAKQKLQSRQVSDLIFSTLLADIPKSSMAAFTAAVSWAPANSRLLHPAATIPYFRVTYPGLVATIGYPGCGNIVVQAILEKIQQNNGLGHNTGFEPFCARLARNHTYLVRGFR